jgi:predicted lipoprotein
MPPLSPNIQAASGTAEAGAPARQRHWTLLCWLAVAALCLAVIAHGITVVPDSEVANTDLNGNPLFRAKSYVASIWETRVLAYLRDKSNDAAAVLAALSAEPDQAAKRYGFRARSSDGPWNFAVHGEGRITAADTKLRHATVTVDVAGHPAVLQIGPVIFGTALRDGLPFVSFDQVANQIQFAQISRELNDRASAAARAGLDVGALLPGRRVRFTGMMTAVTPPQVTVVDLRLLSDTP